MTCIVAVETPAGVWMGGDRMASNWSNAIDLDQPKVFRVGPALIGSCGSIRQMQLLRYALTIPEDTLSWDVDRWVATDLTRAVLTMAEEWQASRVKDGVSQSHNALFAIRGRCYELQSDYSFTRCRTGEYAIGSGYEYAFGAMYGTRSGLPQVRVSLALQAAAERCPTVAGPFDIEFQEASA